MTYQTAFPDFVLDVTIPAGFADVSYVNDSCPSWHDETNHLFLFVNYADPELREFPETPRFYLAKQNLQTDVSMTDLLLTNDWQEMQAKIDSLRS